MGDLIVGMLNSLAQGPTGELTSLVSTPGEYNSTLYNAVVGLHNTAVKPITAVVLSIIIVLSLAENSTRMEVDRDLGFKIVSGTMLKAVMVIIAAQQATKILGAIDEVASEIAGAALGMQVGANGQAVMIGDQLRPQVESAGVTEQLAILVIVFVPFLLSKGAGIAVIVAIYLRFIHLYLLTAFASLPMSFFGHSETKHMGLGYLKKYASVALTGVVLIVAMSFYRALVDGWLQTAVGAPGDDLVQYVLDGIGPFLVAPLLLLFVVFGASTAARAIVGE